MSKVVQYITNEQGKRVGVLLDLNTYSQLSHRWELDEECLVGLRGCFKSQRQLKNYASRLTIIRIIAMYIKVSEVRGNLS